MTSHVTKRILPLLLAAFIAVGCLPRDQRTQQVSVSPEEYRLYGLIMEYRAQSGLAEIPLSKSLSRVAQTHVKDLEENGPSVGECNIHSWSDKGDWTPCCYKSDHGQAACMWSKPAELTSYPGIGFEISHWYTGRATAQSAIRGWKTSTAHRDLMLNRGIWNEPWNAVGVGIYGEYAVVWFGNLSDGEGVPQRRATGGRPR